MGKENCQRIKLLKLVELSRQETDDLHPLTTRAICARLEKFGISCDRRTLSKDITLLNQQGYEVMFRWVGKEKGYYILDRSFSIPELKILIDAVQAASFITEKKTSERIAKIADLGGSHRADILKSNIVNFNNWRPFCRQVVQNHYAKHCSVNPIASILNERISNSALRFYFVFYLFCVRFIGHIIW